MCRCDAVDDYITYILVAKRNTPKKVLNLKIAGDDGIHGFWFKNIHVHPRRIHSSSEKMTRGCKYSVMDDLGEDFSHPDKVRRTPSRRAKQCWKMAWLHYKIINNMFLWHRNMFLLIKRNGKNIFDGKKRSKKSRKKSKGTEKRKPTSTWGYWTQAQSNTSAEEQSVCFTAPDDWANERKQKQRQLRRPYQRIKNVIKHERDSDFIVLGAFARVHKCLKGCWNSRKSGWVENIQTAAF